MSGGGRRKDHVHRRKKYVFYFYDDGVGIREEERDRIFGKYQRSERSMGTEGSGLGLAIVKAIMERHGGRVWVDRDMQKGAAFHISVSKTLEIDQDIIEA